MASEIKDAKKGKPCVSVYFEDEAQLEGVRKASGGNLSEYCRERILYDEGFADDRQRIAARLLRLVEELSGDLNRVCDLVRAHHALRKVLKGLPGHSAFGRLTALLNAADGTIEKLLQSSERSSGVLTQLTQEIRDYALACADYELAQKRAATIQQRHKVKP